jgi:hypothetical protein
MKRSNELYLGSAEVEFMVVSQSVDAEKVSCFAQNARLMERWRMQVLVPVAIMQPDQGAVGGQAYMFLNREDLKDFPMMAAGQGMMMPSMHIPTVVDPKRQQDGEHLMDVLAGAANCVAVGQAVGLQQRHREEDADEEEDEESKAVEKQPLTTRSGRKRNPSRTL